MFSRFAHTLVVLLFASCGGRAWNNPYPATDTSEKVLYGSFSERPKHFDPVRSYVANEYAIIAQIYEPPLQYHFLRRPYELVTLTAETVPTASYRDDSGNRLPESVPAEDIATSVYEVRIQPGIHFQPHPCFARDADEKYRYHNLQPGALDAVYVLGDFKHQGSRELVAADYVYQLKRMAHPKLHSPIAGLMSQYIVGLREYAGTLTKAFSSLSAQDQERGYLDLRKYDHPGVEVVSRYTYRVTIRGKYPQFIYWLAMPFFAPMPWEADRFYGQQGMADRNITLDWYPVGTGPFMLIENNPNRRMVLVRNPRFRGEAYPTDGEDSDSRKGLLRDAAKPMPFIERAIYSLEKEDIPYWNKFLQGYYDRSAITSDSFDQAIRFTAAGDAQLTPALLNKGIKLSTAVSTSIYFWGFNMLDRSIGGYSAKQRKLRRAISIAMDIEEFVSIFANGRGIVAQGPIPPGIFGHVPGEAGVNRHVFDWRQKAQRRALSDARRLLAEAGFPDGRSAATGKPLVLYFDTAATGPDDKARLDWFRKQFAKLKIQLVVRATDFNRFQDKVRKGTWQMLFWGWNADYPDPENFLFLLYGPNAKVGHGGENHVNYKNARYDELFAQMKHMENGPARQAVIDEMVDILRTDAPWIWGFHPKAFSLYHQWYGNMKPNLMANNLLKYKRVAPEIRARLRAHWNRPVAWPIALVVVLLAISIVPAAVAFRRRERRAAR